MQSEIRFFTALLLIFCIKYSCAQQTVLSAGGDATGNEGSVSYSAGQVAFMTLSGSEGTITEGVQQPYEILFNGIYYESGISLECAIYPNPVATTVTLKVEKHELKTLSYWLCDMKGLVIRESMITEKETIIPMADYIAGSYFLTVSENNSALVCYKIIKK